MFSKTYKNVDMSKYNISSFIHQSDSDTAVLILHGLSASAQQMIYINEGLMKNDFNVFCPNLPGHASTLEKLDTIKYQDWIKFAENYYLKLNKRYKNVFLFGHSLGGHIALYLASQYNVTGFIITNTALWYYGLSRTIHFAPYLSFILKHVPNPKIFIKDPNSIDKYTYKKTSSSASGECLKLSKLLRTLVKKVSSPALIFKSEEDSFLLKNHKHIYGNISSKVKKLIILNNSYHDAILDYDKNIIIDKTIEFIKGVINEN